MNKLKITLGIVTVLLIVIVTAQILSIRNVDVELTKSEKDKLAEYNIITPETSELICDDDVCEYMLYQIIGYKNKTRMVINESNSSQYIEGYYLIEIRHNLGTHTIERGDLSRTELEAEQQTQITEWLKVYSKILEDREIISEKEIISNKTRITIKEQRK